MNKSSRNIWIVATAVAFLQATFLVWMVWDRVSIISNGKEIILNVEPIDPRSLFRGDYVILNYTDASVLNSRILDAPTEAQSSICVTFDKAPDDEIWKPIAATKSCPRKLGIDQVAVKGKVRAIRAAGEIKASAFVTYGIESYFVPEGTGKTLEQKIAKGALQVLVAVDKSGRAAIKGLIVEGKRIYDEPLW